ncbi:MAG: InlB B-repeat-containing protein, partial [Clostridia bacterium]
STSSMTMTYDVSKSLTTNGFTKTGYTFTGWNTNVNGTGTSYTNAQYVKNLTTGTSIILYAQWQVNTYTVSYNANGGFNAPSSQTKTYGVALTLSPNEPTLDGYTFIGWSTNSVATTATYLPSDIFTTNANTTLYAVWEINSDIYPEIVIPNATYNEDTEIIVSYTIYNDGANDITPTSNAIATLLTENTSSDGTVSIISTDIQDVIIPANDMNLIYFKILIPEDSDTITLTLEITSDVVEDTLNNIITDTIDVSPIAYSQTADTVFENAPTSFVLSNRSTAIYTTGQDLENTATWSVWEWIDDDFEYVTYEINLNLSTTIETDSVVETEIVSNGITTMKSGYGITIDVTSDLSFGTNTPNEDSYTLLQSGNVYLPEFSYSYSYGNYRTLALIDDVLQFEGNEYTIASDGMQDYRNVHFTPIWYPDDEYYTVQIYGYNLWTPAGMINSTSTESQIYISGNIYDDWYVAK